MTTIGVTREDEIATAILKAVRQIDDGEELEPVVRCPKCAHHDTYTCPENRVWCNMLRRYMSLDGYCSYGEQKDNV